MATAGARLRGAGLVIAVESAPNRQKLARRYGAEVIVDFKKSGAVAEILRHTDGVIKPLIPFHERRADFNDAL